MWFPGPFVICPCWELRLVSHTACSQSILQPAEAVSRHPTTYSHHQNRTQADSPKHSSSSSVTDSCSSRKSFRFPSVLLCPYPRP